jgi:hypothetical protein
MQFAHLVANVPLTFPGPGGGFTLAHFPVHEITKYGDTLTVTHAFLVDLGTANEGNFLPADTLKLTTGYTPWELVPATDRIIHVSLAASGAHPEYRELDSTYFGMLGYAFFKQFVTVFDFKNKRLLLYSLYSTVDVADKDTAVLQGQYVDDEFLTYCHCPYPTIWLMAEAPPLKAGHVHLALEMPLSEVYKPALDAETKTVVDRRAIADSLAGKKGPVGLSLAQFKIWNKNIASLNPHRYVSPLPPIFKDLSAPVMGTIATDVLRRYSALIIDPVRTRLVLVK